MVESLLMIVVRRNPQLVAAHYRAIIGKIRKQMEVQR
jgi:hypothetical protein